MSFGSFPNSSALASLFRAWPWWWLKMLHWRLIKSLSTSFSLLAACILSWTWVNRLLTGIALIVTFLAMFNINSCHTVRFLLLISDSNIFEIDLTRIVCFIGTWWNHWTMSLRGIHGDRLLAWHFLMWWTTLSLLLINVTKPQSFGDAHRYTERVEMRMKVLSIYFKTFWLLLFDILKHAEWQLSLYLLGATWVESCVETDERSVLHESQFDYYLETIFTDLISRNIDNFEILVDA